MAPASPPPTTVESCFQVLGDHSNRRWWRNGYEGLAKPWRLALRIFGSNTKSKDPSKRKKGALNRFDCQGRVCVTGGPCFIGNKL